MRRAFGRNIRIEPVALTGDHLDQPALLVAERKTQLADALKQIVFADMDIRPYRFHQLLLAQHPPGIGGEQRQHLERLGPELDLAAVGTAQFRAVPVEFEIGKADDHSIP